MKIRELVEPQYSHYDFNNPRFPLSAREQDAVSSWQRLIAHCGIHPMIHCAWAFAAHRTDGCRIGQFELGCREGRALFLAAWRAQRLWDAERRLIEWPAPQQGLGLSGAMEAMKAVYQAALAGVVHGGQKP